MALFTDTITSWIRRLVLWQYLASSFPDNEPDSRTSINNDHLKLPYMDFILPSTFEEQTTILSGAAFTILLITTVLLSMRQKQSYTVQKNNKCDAWDASEIATLVRADKMRLQDLEGNNKTLKSKLAKAESALVTAKSESATRKKTAETPTKQSEKQKNQIAQLQNTLTKRNVQLKASETALKDLQSRYTNLENQKVLLAEQLIAANAEIAKTMLQVQDELRSKAELKFDNELLKCEQDSHVKASITDSVISFSNLAAPFVLFIVDGDAYTWSSSHFFQRDSTPGAHAAQAIKSEIQQYLVENKERIPLTSRIVTRVFYNAEGSIHVGKNIRRLAKHQLGDFGRTFTEYSPLFDYIDCGRGKERADSKIQETVHLFISNPQCQTIFLAAATDNGFARLLEQYACVEEAKRKLILVHPGYIVPEISELNYPAVEWPKVFQKRDMPNAVVRKVGVLSARKDREKAEIAGYAARAVVEDMSGLGPFTDLWHVKLGPRRWLDILNTAYQKNEEVRIEER